MPIPKRTELPTNTADLRWMITDDGSRTLIDHCAGQTFHSGCGAASESLVVYLVNSGVARRLVARKPTNVMEVGFGTGTNFFLTAGLAELTRSPLTYDGFDVRILPLSIHRDLGLTHSLERDSVAATLNALDAPCELASANYRNAVRKIEQEFCSWLETCSTGAGGATKLAEEMTILLGEFSTLRLRLGDITKVARRLARDDSLSDKAPGLNLPPQSFDAIYFDAFSPEASPEIWSSNMYRFAFESLRLGGSLTTYCVKGDVRRGLQQAGFQVKRLPGPIGGKREVLTAWRLP